MKQLIAIAAFAALLLRQGDVCRAQWVQTNGPYGGIVTCLALQADTVYAGTNGGVFRSTDSGSHWHNLNSPPNVNAILLSNSKIFASCGEHVFVTSNNGAEWVEADSGLDSKSEPIPLVGTETNLFTCPDGNVYRSTNGGVSWFSDTNTNENLYFSSLFIAGQNLFAGVDGEGTFISTNFGESWSQMDGALGSIEISSLVPSGANLFATAANYLFFSKDTGLYWNIADTFADIYAMAISGPDIYISTGYGISFSSDSGLTWKTKTEIAFNNFAIIGNDILGSGDGISKSSDSGSTWVSSESGLIATTIQTIASDQKTLFLGTETGIFTSTDGGVSWLSEDSGLTYENVRRFFVDSGVVYACGGSIYSSMDEGLTWIIDSVGLPLSDVFDLTRAGNSLWACTDHKGIVFYSTDNAQTWISDSTGLPVPTADGAEVMGFGNNILVGVHNTFGLFSSSDFGPWDQINGTQSLVHGLNCFLTAGTNLFAGLDVDEVLISSDSGLSWANISNGLPYDEFSTGGGVTSLLSVDEKLFAGSEFGIYLSTNNGNSWTNETSGLTNTKIQGLAFQDGFLFAATAGSGVWRRSLSDFGISTVAQTPSSPPQIQSYPNPFTQSTTITFSSQDEGYADVTVVNLLGSQVARIFSGELTPSEHSFTWDANGMAPGMYECIVRMNGQAQRISMILSEP